MSVPWVIIGVSGSGKSTLLERLLSDYPGKFCSPVSHTTRSPRAGEIDGAAYHFITPEKYDHMVASGEFVENIIAYGNKYGLTRKALEDAYASSKIPLVVFGIEGLEQIIAAKCNPKVILVHGPDEEKLRERMVLRGDKDVEIEKRIKMTQEELMYYAQHADKFDTHFDNSAGSFDLAYETFVKKQRLCA